MASVAPQVGLAAGGTPVSIRGKWLGDVVSVWFGSAQAAGAVDVIVQGTAGRAVISPAQYIYLPAGSRVDARSASVNPITTT